MACGSNNDEICATRETSNDTIACQRMQSSGTIHSADACYYMLHGGSSSGYLLRRFLEVLLLHECSKEIPNSIVKGLVAHFGIAIGFLNFYILQTEAKPHTVAVSEQAIRYDVEGCGIFIVSQIESVRHHAILRGLRESAAVVGTPHTKKRGRDKGALYHIPKGGLFDACACPHYMYEAVGWFAIAVCVRHLYAWALAVQMTLILMGRAFRTRNWYREKFDDYPASMAAFIPYIL